MKIQETCQIEIRIAGDDCTTIFTVGKDKILKLEYDAEKGYCELIRDGSIRIVFGRIRSVLKSLTKAE